MKKLLIFFTTFLFLFLCSHQNPIFSEDSEIEVQVRAAGMPVITPEPEFTRGSSNTIYWSVAELAVEYYAEASTDGSFVFVSANSGWISEQSYTFTNLDDDTLYFYRVKARNIAGTEGLWSASVFSTQDDNAPESAVLPLDDITLTAEVNLSFDYSDETSGVDEITLYYRRNSEIWMAYATFSAQDNYIFNTLLTGGDGQYEFYSIAIDNVGNVEYESPHVDADTIVRTTEPPPPAPPEPVPPPAPEPEPVPEPSPAENYIFIYTFDGVYVRELDFVEITTVDPVVTGYARPMRTLNWRLYNNSNTVISENSLRSDDRGYWEMKLPSLDEGRYQFQISYSDAGIRYIDSIGFEIKRSRIVNIEGFAFPDAVISIFFNNRLSEVANTNKAGYFVGEIVLPIDFNGDLLFTARKGDFVSSLSHLYNAESGEIIEIIFPPILYPAYQEIDFGNTAQISGFAVPRAKIKIYYDGNFVEEIISNDDGSFSFQTDVLNPPSQHEFRCSQIINEIESNKSSPVLIYVREPEPFQPEPVPWYENPTIETVTEYIVPGVTSVGLTLQGINLITTFGSAPNVFLRIGLVFDALFGKRRKKRSWGIVYDMYENICIPFAVVRLHDARTREFVKDTVTDLKGRYMFSVEDGLYMLGVSHPDYIFVRSQGKDFIKNRNLFGKYLGGEIKVEKGVSISYDIPMMSKEMAKKGIGYVSYKDKFKLIINRISTVLSIASVIILIFSTIVSPSIVNYVLLALNAVVLILLTVIRVSRERNWGMVYDAISKKPMRGVFVRLFDAKEKRLINSQITDQNGKFGFLTDKGEYLLTVDLENFELSESVKETITIKDLGKAIKVVIIKGGLVKLNIPLKKAEEKIVEEKAGKEEIVEETPFGA